MIKRTDPVILQAIVGYQRIGGISIITCCNGRHRWIAKPVIILDGLYHVGAISIKHRLLHQVILISALRKY